MNPRRRRFNRKDRKAKRGFALMGGPDGQLFQLVYLSVFQHELRGVHLASHKLYIVKRESRRHYRLCPGVA